ncbi:hypothetical protein [Numidum massiliense]|uniref:hypothetical protein n=1 Tax=Numidum massiliense TaxID=1522315 RepID=UPI0006D5A979|nr:hypothetical protein [Numidum massiliense]
MVRTFGSTLVAALALAIALSYLPQVELSGHEDVAVFKRERPTALSEATLVDFLTLQKPRFTYLRAYWDDVESALYVDFQATAARAKADVAAGWLPFLESVFRRTSNVQTLTCRLYGADGAVRATLTAQKKAYTPPRANDSALHYLERHFHFQVNE